MMNPAKSDAPSQERQPLSGEDHGFQTQDDEQSLGAEPISALLDGELSEHEWAVLMRCRYKVRHRWEMYRLIADSLQWPDAVCDEPSARCVRFSARLQSMSSLPDAARPRAWQAASSRRLAKRSALYCLIPLAACLFLRLSHKRAQE